MGGDMSGYRSTRRFWAPLFLFPVLMFSALQTTHAQGRAARAVPGAPTAAGPRLYQSRNFQLRTDLSEPDAKELLDRLESMLKLVSAYWGKPNRKPIPMYVVDDLTKWPQEELQQMAPEGLQAISQGGGLTITAVRGIVGGPKLDSQCIVYATSDHGTPQHEAVHAYCGTTFGALGPVWYAEGMAEVGNYWRENDKGVHASEYVIEYLQSQQPRPLNDIVNNPLETTGDSWQNYAWRWALCHLLGFNENYTQRFKPLGQAFLADKDVDFWKVYGAQAAEIEFEYKLFLKDLEPGYRCDLCSWDWKTRFKGINGAAQLSTVLRADRGWQSSRLKVSGGTEYFVTADGEWQVEEQGEKVTVAGDESGRGKLVGIVFSDFQLSEPFEIGGSESFVAPSDGNLYLRCQDGWGALMDNKGSVTIRLSASPSREH